MLKIAVVSYLDQFENSSALSRCPFLKANHPFFFGLLLLALLTSLALIKLINLVEQSRTSRTTEAKLTAYIYLSLSKKILEFGLLLCFLCFYLT